jgi:penicillin amidase
MPNLRYPFPSQPASAATLRRRRKSRKPQILLWAAGGLVALLAIAVVVSALWIRHATIAALPELDGALRVPGLSAPVTVLRDAHGVPHIQATTQDDLFFAQGYVTAQDRLWQMDALRRNASGELAEILGPSFLKHDKAQRVLLFRSTARRIYANLPAEDRTRFDDYARGVNAFIAQHPDTLPPEFDLLFYRPRPWSGEDSICIGLTMVQMLDTHFDTKLAREAIAAKLHNPKLEADLYPVGSWRDHPPTGILLDLSQPHPEPPPSSDDEEEEERTQASAAPSSPPQHAEGIAASAVRPSDARAPSLSQYYREKGGKAQPFEESFFPTLAPETRRKDGARSSLSPHEDPAALRAVLGLPDCAACAPGSNNWVVAGRHTASGKPLLANDMHLGLSVPNIWYMADLQAHGYHAAGVTLPGVPFVIAGHNEHVAWGFTALYADVQDLYIEKLDGKGNFQDLDGSWKPLAVSRETVKVRGGKDILLDVQSTAHGPLLNPIFAKETRAIALKWTLYDPKLNSLPLYQLNTAANWAEFSGGLAAWCWPTQNVVYSDDQGHIAYQAVGRVPLRADNPSGVPLAHGADGLKGEWTGYIPFEQMPSAVDPPSGFLATANSRVTSEKFSYPITLEWIDPYRIERIYKALQGRDQLAAKDMLAVQNDVYSEVDQELGQRFAYAIDHADGADERLRKAADLMRNWDGRLTADSAAASIVTQAHRALWPLILEPKLGKDAAAYKWAESNFAQEEIVMHANPDWLPSNYKNWDALLTDAVRKGMNGLGTDKAPADVARWSYGSWHVVDLEHPLTDFLPRFLQIAGTGPQPLSGDGTTVKQVGRTFGPSQRFTMDWNDIDGSTENIVLGESGNPASPYFRDQWNDWYGGTTFALPFTPAAVAAQARHTLHLLP